MAGTGASGLTSPIQIQIRPHARSTNWPVPVFGWPSPGWTTRDV